MDASLLKNLQSLQWQRPASRISGFKAATEDRMKGIVTAAFMVSALLVGAAEVHAFAWGGGRSGGGSSSSVQSDSTKGPNASVPEPSSLYAVGSAIALLGGAGWYIRRRK
jgi:hypothetical protein